MSRLEVEIAGSNKEFRSAIKDSISALDDLKKYAETIKIDMFGASTSSELQQLEKDLASVSKVMSDFASNAQKGSNAINSGLKTAITELKVSEQELKNEYAKSRVELAKYNLEQKKIQDAQKESTRLANEAKKAQKDLLAERRRQEAEARKANAEAERRRKQLEKENSEYYKLSSTLGKLRKEAKDVLAEMFKLEGQGKKGSAAYQQLADRARVLTAQTNHLDTGLKKIDASLGLHQRNVGNYSSALSSLSPQFSRLSSQLASMGVDINELSGKGKSGGLAALGAGLANTGRAIGSFFTTGLGAAVGVLGAGVAYFRSAIPVVREFNSGLLNVSKTTGISGIELDSLSDSIVKLSRSLKTVGTDKLLQYATVAGQLGVKGSENILNFAEALAQLETASDITGEQGGAEIARLLTLTDGGVKNIKAFGDEIVNLGNNFAATEKEILSNAESIAQNTALYNFGRQNVLAYAAATKSVGLEADITGSALFRALAKIEQYANGAKGADKILKLMNLTQKELSDNFKKDSAGTLTLFISKLNEINDSGGSVTATLERLGLNNQRDIRVLSTLASSGYGQLENAMITVENAAGSMGDEFKTASEKLVNQTARIGIAWDNIVLSIENGTGVIGRSTVLVVDFFADMLESINKLGASTSFEEFFTRLSGYIGIGSKALSNANADLIKFRKDQERLMKDDPFAYTLGRFDTYPKGAQEAIIRDNRAQLQAMKDRQKAEGDSSKQTLDNLSKQIKFVKDLEDKYNSLHKVQDKPAGETEKELTEEEIKARKRATERIEQIIRDSNARITTAGKENRERELAQIGVYYTERLRQVKGNAKATEQLIENRRIEEDAVNAKWNQKEIDDRKKVENEINTILASSIVEKARTRDRELELNDIKYKKLKEGAKLTQEDILKLEQARLNEAEQINIKHNERDFQAMANFVTRSNRNREQALIEQLELESRLKIAAARGDEEKLNEIYREFAEKRKQIMDEQAERRIIANNDGSPFYMEIAQAELALDNLKKRFEDGLISRQAFDTDRRHLQGLLDSIGMVEDLAGRLGETYATSFGALIFEGENASKTIANAFKSMANQIIADLLRIAATKAFANLFSGGLFGGIGKIFGFAGGGYTGNIGRNKIAGVVHGQEMVINADATKKNRALLEAINSGKVIQPSAVNTPSISTSGVDRLQVEVTGEISGQNIRLSQKRTEQRQTRFYANS